MTRRSCLAVRNLQLSSSAVFRSSLSNHSTMRKAPLAGQFRLFLLLTLSYIPPTAMCIFDVGDQSRSSSGEPQPIGINFAPSLAWESWHDLTEFNNRLIVLALLFTPTAMLILLYLQWPTEGQTAKTVVASCPDCIPEHRDDGPRAISSATADAR